MKKITFFTVVILLPLFVLAKDAENPMYGFFAGKYIVVGKKIGSRKTYTGKIIIKNMGDHLAVTRIIEGEKIKCTGKLERTIAGDRNEVLRVRFEKGGKKFEITYLWRSDLDNYARLSGHLYYKGEKTERPGLEVLFIDHSD